MAVDYRAAAHLATITINRPEARNAVNADVAAGIEAGIDRAEQDPRVRVVILAGAIGGEPSPQVAGGGGGRPGQGQQDQRERGGEARHGDILARATQPVASRPDDCVKRRARWAASTRSS